ncbi:S4 RNA-binding domain-containing protein [Forsythia ovata]|uniref:S4 RNA-binding domain-containing protein n=1 Tax=Forsythia ovata TaxID=205694 RepID=A0ABD1S0R5_9LAMI
MSTILMLAVSKLKNYASCPLDHKQVVPFIPRSWEKKFQPWIIKIDHVGGLEHFKGPEGTAPLNLYVENEFHRSTRGGAGDVKSITNYSPARGLKKHLKRLNAPKHWMLDKLGGAFCPLNVMHAGSQTVIRTPQIKGVLALILILRNRLKYALTYREVIAILMQRHILVDGKVRTDKTYPAGFMGMHFHPILCMHFHPILFVDPDFLIGSVSEL